MLRRELRGLLRLPAVWPQGEETDRRGGRQIRSLYHRALCVEANQRVRERLGLRRRAFERAYRDGSWTTTGESLSGNGSSVAATESLRRALPDALRALRIQTLLDVPCGDWNWMAHVDLPVRRYIGGELIPWLVEANRERFGDERHEFRVIDLCNDPLPPADLLLCRDALIHFSYYDIWRALANIAASEIAYLATTTFPGTRQNCDILTGIAWRHLNLEVEPFNFPPPLMSLPEGFNRPDQVLAIWRVSDLPASPPASREGSLPEG